MQSHLPVRRFLQTSEKTEVAQARFGSMQWVLARPLYRFQTFDLAQVPEKSRSQALQLELAQWTPFARSGYFSGWSGARAFVWAWNADKVQAAIAAQGLKPQRVQVIPESVLQTPVQSGLCLTRCVEGFEGQLWQAGLLTRSRWWPQVPSADEWLNFQRDAAIGPDEQQAAPPSPRHASSEVKPWLHSSDSAESFATLLESPLMALCLLGLLGAALWYGLSLYKVQNNTDQLRLELTQLQTQAEPLLQARRESLDHLARINTLRGLDRLPDQLTLLARVAQVLPKDGSSLKDWDFAGNQLKFTLSSTADLSATNIIDALQRAGPFGDVKAMPGRDPKAVTFQMEVTTP